MTFSSAMVSEWCWFLFLISILGSSDLLRFPSNVLWWIWCFLASLSSFWLFCHLQYLVTGSCSWSIWLSYCIGPWRKFTHFVASCAFRLLVSSTIWQLRVAVGAALALQYLHLVCRHTSQQSISSFSVFCRVPICLVLRFFEYAASLLSVLSPFLQLFALLAWLFCSILSSLSHCKGKRHFVYGDGTAAAIFILLDSVQSYRQYFRRMETLWD